MNPQEMFDKVFKELFNQGRPSVGRNPRSTLTACLYRSPDGAKCAGGLFITNEQYTEEMENQGGINNINEIHKLGFSPDEIEVLTRLQQAHDGAAKSGMEINHLTWEFALGQELHQAVNDLQAQGYKIEYRTPSQVPQ